MKRSLPLSLFLGILLLLVTGASVKSQVSLPHYDGMEYTAGSALQTLGGWTANNTGDDLLIAEGSLSYPGLAASKGNKVTFNGLGIDAYKSIATQLSGTVYYSFILKVTDVSLATNSNGGYFTGLGQTSSMFGATVWLFKDESNFKIGINTRTTTTVTVFSTESFPINTEILVVAGYQFNENSGDDVASLWINPSSESFGSSTVPTPTLTVTNTGGTDLTGISSVFIRQDSDSETPFIEMDELRISTNWADVVPLTALVDLDAPVFTDGYPRMANIDATQADLEVNMDEAGTAYYVVVPDGSTAPSVAEVVAGADYGTVTLVAHGTVDVAAGGAAYSATITGLTDKTDYDIYVVAEDDESTPNRQADAVMVNLYTIRPPDVIKIYDFASDLGEFIQVSITGDQVWTQESGYAYMNGYSGSNNENEDWLISPAINLNASEMNALSFMSAKNYTGPDIQVYISQNFSGNNTAADVAAATWTEITSQFSFSTGSYNWVGSGSFNLDAYSDDIYIAFKYTSTSTTGAGWKIDDVKLTGYLLPGSDATLSDLKVDDVTITGFDGAVLGYSYIMEADWSTTPVVTFTTTDVNATAELAGPADLNGDAAARTASVTVVAADGVTSQTYTILFNPIIAVADMAALRAVAPADFNRIYQVTGEVIITGLNDANRHQKYVQDGTAGVTIDDPDGKITTVYSVGDGVKNLTGTLTEYQNLLELVPYRDPGAAFSTGNTVTPQEVTIADFKTNQESYESELVKIIGVSFSDANGTAAFAEKKNYTISVGADATILRTIFLGTDLKDKVIPYMADVTGIAAVYSSDAQVAPRNYADLVIYSSVGSLSDLRVSGTTVTGFAAGTLTYNVSLAAGTTVVPTVTATPTEANASVVITPAASLTGDAAARTTTIAVTSHDKSSSTTYSIVFSVATGIEDNLSGRFTIYPVPARTGITITDIDDVRFIEIYDVTGKKLITEICESDHEKTIPVSQLARGVYFVRFTTPQGTVMKRFVKE